MWRATTEDTNNVLEDENDLVLAMKIKQDVLPCERKPVKCLGQNISWDQDLCQTLERLESVVV